MNPFLYAICALFVLPNTLSAIELAKVELRNGMVVVAVDPRVELIGMVFLETSWEAKVHSWGNYDHRAYDYYQAIKQRQKPFKDHPAITLAEKLVSERNFIWDAIPKFVLHHSDPPELHQTHPYDQDILRRAGQPPILEDLANALRDFARRIRFNSFFEENRTSYAQLVKGVLQSLPSDELVKSLTKFYGWRLPEYRIVLAPSMFPGGGYAVQIPFDDPKECTVIVRVAGVRDGHASFGDIDEIFLLALHEFGHCYINPTTERFREEVEDLRPLYAPIEQSLKRTVARDWVTKFNEQVIRAATISIAMSQDTRFDVEKAIRKEEDIGLYLTRELLELFNDQIAVSEHSQSRIEDRYPQILQLYRDLAAEKNATLLKDE